MIEPIVGYCYAASSNHQYILGSFVAFVQVGQSSGQIYLIEFKSDDSKSFFLGTGMIIPLTNRSLETG